MPTSQVFDLVLQGYSIAYAAAVCQVPFVEADQIVRDTLDMRRKQNELIPELEVARLDALTAAVWPKAIEGDTDSVREFRGLSEGRRRLVGADAKVEDVHVHEVHVTFAFPGGSKEPQEIAPEDGVRLAQVVGRSAPYGLRPAPDSVGGDGDEDREDDSGSGLDRAGDSSR